MLGRFYQRSVPPQLQVESRPFSSSGKAFILRFSDGLFLFSYQSDGIYATSDLQQAKLFVTPPTSAADIFHAEICTVFVNADGSGVRRTLLDRAATGASKTPEKEQNPASDGEESDAGTRADGDGQIPPSFLVRNILTTQRAQLEDGKRLLFHFIEEFLQIELFGLQSGFGLRPDSLLFVGPHGVTLAVPVVTLLEPREIALEIIRRKIESSHKQFKAVG